MVLKRDRAWWNSRVVILTTPDMMDDKVHMEFKAGSQNHYHVPCLSCGCREPLAFANLKAEHPQTHQCVKWSEVPGVLDADKKWDFELLAPQIRYVCPACGHLHPDHPAVRRRFAAEGQWVSHNPKAPFHHVSYTWSALLPPWVKWRKVVEEFILAQNALEFGNHEPLKMFITETLGEPWEDRLRFTKSENYINERLSDFGGPFVEARRFLMIDVQGKGGRHFYWSVHAFAQGGAQRVLAYGKAWSVEELRGMAVEWKVQPQNVGIDSGHFTAEVYGYVIESGVLPNGDYAWKVFKGDRAPHYLVDGVRMPFTYSWVDPYLGTTRQNQVRPIRQVLFSKTNLLDRAEAIMRGLGAKLELPKDDAMIHEYMQQLTAYERFEKPNAKGEIQVEWVQKRPDDHWGSTFRMALVAALATGVMDVR
jgi:hypothetical protein